MLTKEMSISLNRRKNNYKISSKEQVKVNSQMMELIVQLEQPTQSKRHMSLQTTQRAIMHIGHQEVDPRLKRADLKHLGLLLCNFIDMFKASLIILTLSNRVLYR